MKLTPGIPRRILSRSRHDEPDIIGRITAALAVLAWLVLASDALAQDANRWAPDAGGQMPVAPVTGQVWSSNGDAVPVYAPIDLDQQLASGTLKAPVAPAAQGAPVQAPVYAPAGTATSRLAPPSAPVTAPLGSRAGISGAVLTQPYAGVYPAQPFSPAQAYGYGVPTAGQPYTQPYGQPYGQAYPQPYAQAYAQPFAPQGYAYPYPGAVGSGLYPGIAPGLGGWAAPYGAPGGYGGVPFFGASPFGFW